MSVTLFIIVALVGVVVGILSGLLGIGGGMIMVPLFRLIFGLSPLQATGTSLLAIVPTSLAGLIQHLRQHDLLVVLGVASGIAGACTSPLGVQLAAASPGWLVMLVAAIVIAFSAVKTLKKAVKSPKKSTSSQASSSTPQSTSGNELMVDPPHKRQILMGIPIGLVAGVLSGYIGVGGGFIMVPLFSSLVHASMRQSTATSLVSITILAIPGAILQLSLGNAQLMIALAMVVGSIPGAILGAYLAKRINDRALRFAFGAMLLVAAIMLVVN